VSDGGAVHNCGSFGWVIGHKDGRRLAQGSGSVFGFDPRSYRAEGHGAKASHLFILHCFRYCKKSIPTGQFTFYCDNQGLLKKLTYLLSYKKAIHATCLHSEWDIVSSVYHLQSRFNPPPELLHVKGHQDDESPLEELDLQSLLNIEADALATTELQEYGSIKHSVPFDPSCEVQLTIAGRTVTRQLGYAIPNQQHLAAFRQYYEKRFAWDQSIFGTIDWPHFAMVYT
jgi:hypothetical protein